MRNEGTNTPKILSFPFIYPTCVEFVSAGETGCEDATAHGSTHVLDRFRTAHEAMA